MSIKPWPILTLLMEGGPDDGLVINVPAGKGPVPPEGLPSAHDPLVGGTCASGADGSVHRLHAFGGDKVAVRLGATDSLAVDNRWLGAESVQIRP